MKTASITIRWGPTGYVSELEISAVQEIDGWTLIWGRLVGAFRSEPAFFAATTPRGKTALTGGRKGRVTYRCTGSNKAMLWTKSGLESWGLGIGSSLEAWKGSHAPPLVLGEYVCIHQRRGA